MVSSETFIKFGVDNFGEEFVDNSSALLDDVLLELDRLAIFGLIVIL